MSRLKTLMVVAAGLSQARGANRGKTYHSLALCQYQAFLARRIRIAFGSLASRRVGLLPLLILASGCATVVKGTDESVTVETDPAGAICDLTRDEEIVGVINPSPGTVEVDRDNDDIIVKCVLEGYEMTEGRLVSEFSGATLGNVLLGGIIGIAVDAASGANSEYPDSIHLIMLPKVFTSEEQRDAVYAKLKDQVENRHEKLIDRRRNRCLKGAEVSCERQIKEIEESRDRELLALEDKRLQATVTPLEAQAGAQNGGVTSQAAVQAEDAYWRAIENSTDPEAYRAYLAAYPDGRFKDTALQRMRAETAEKMKPVTTGPMPKPELAVGDSWIGLKDGKDYHWRVVSRKDNAYTREDSEGCRWTTEPWSFAPSYEWSDCPPFSDGRTKITSITGKLWPLQVGNKISYAFNGSRKFGKNPWSGTRTCEVKARERITTTSGDHDTYKIVCDDPFVFRTHYVSPTLKAVVYQERTRKRGDQRAKYELIETKSRFE